MFLACMAKIDWFSTVVLQPFYIHSSMPAEKLL